MQCPTCHRGLTPSRFDLAETHVCTRCTGVWIDEPELASLIDTGHATSIADLTPPEFHSVAESAKTCPRCLKNLDEYLREPLADLTVAGCLSCGGLFFHDEALEERHRFRIGTSVDPEAPGEALNIIDDLLSQSALDQESARFALEWVASKRALPGASRNLSELLVLVLR